MAEEILSKSFSQIFGLFEPTDPEDLNLSKFLKNLDSSLCSINLVNNPTPSSITQAIEQMIKEVPNDFITTRPSTLPSANLFTKAQLKRLNLI